MKSDDFGAASTGAELKLTSVNNNVATGHLGKGKTQPVTFPIRKDGNAFAGKLIFDQLSLA